MKTVDNNIDFIKELSVINKSKFSLQQTKSLYLGLLFELMMTKQIFKKNTDLKEFILAVYKKEYADYLFRSRAHLVSRVLKDIESNYNPLDISSSIISIVDYLNHGSSESNKNSVLKKNNLEDDTVNWIKNIIRGKNNS